MALSETQKAGYSKADRPANATVFVPKTPSATTTPSTTPSTTTGGMGTGGASTLGVTDFNANTYLYDTGLQNIFQDYQKSIATLGQQEQQSLQDAYYIREMSKKYLGQYASNLGIGDVSGNLLDIYGQYQQAVAGIRGQTNMAELGLQQQYDAQRRELEMGRTLSEAEGAQPGVAAWVGVNSPQTTDIRTGQPMDNPNYNPDFNIDYYNRPSDWVEGISEVFVDGGGNYAYIGQDVEEEGFGGGVFHEDISRDWQTSNEGQVLVAGMTHIFKGETFILKEGRWFRLRNFSGTGSPQAITLMMQNQQEKWSADNLIVTSSSNNAQIKKANIGFYQDDQNTNMYIVNLENGADKSNKPLSYQIDVSKSSSLFEVSSATQGRQSEILARFREIHADGQNIKNLSIVEYKGKLYFHKDGKIWEMSRRTSF